MGRRAVEPDSDLDAIRVQVPLKPEVVIKIDELAAKMGVARGRMAAMLLEAGVEDNEWIIRVVTAAVTPIKRLVHGWSKAKKPKRQTELPDGT